MLSPSISLNQLNLITMSSNRLKKLRYSTAIIGVLTLLTSSPLFANERTKQDNSETDFTKIEIEISPTKEQPSIILVDKNLKVIAEYYGSKESIKKQFEETFERNSRIAEHNGQRIYFISSF